MVAPVPHDSTGIRSLIPEPAEIRSRLYLIRQQTRLLTRLLRLAESHDRLLPVVAQKGDDLCPRG